MLCVAPDSCGRRSLCRLYRLGRRRPTVSLRNVAVGLRRARRSDVVGYGGRRDCGEDQVIFAVGDYHVVVSVCVSVYGGPRCGCKWCGLIGGNSMLCSGRCPQRGHTSISIPVRASIHTDTVTAGSRFQVIGVRFQPWNPAPGTCRYVNL